MATTNGLSSALSLMRSMHLLKIIPNKDSKTVELMGSGNNNNLVFWFNNAGVLEDTYTIYYGTTCDSITALTETTHYVADLDAGKITLTTAGRTLVALNNVYAAYSYNSSELLNSEIIDALNAAESKVMRETEQTFTTTTLLGYKQISDEKIKGHYDPNGKVFDLYYVPLVKIQTTVNGAFTLGDVTLTLTDASLLPSTGTIYVGGNKVTYTAKSTNDLTVPNTTPTIADGATVRGEVIELSTEPEGTDPSYSVLDPDTDYEIDYDNARFKILANAYWGEVSNEDRIYPSNYLIKASYMHAWHEPSEDPVIPDDIEWVVNAIAARKLMGSVVAKAHTTGLNDFNPGLIDVDKEAIQEVLDEYSTLNVSTSQFNKQFLS